LTTSSRVLLREPYVPWLIRWLLAAFLLLTMIGRRITGTTRHRN
jgi:hypothetical protein